MSNFIAYDIEWDVDLEDVYEQLDDMTCRKAAEALGISEDLYANMTTTERHNYAYDIFHHNRIAISDFAGLPDKVEIPDEFEISSVDDDMQYVTDWLSDQYGYCIYGYKVKEAE